MKRIIILLSLFASSICFGQTLDINKLSPLTNSYGVKYRNAWVESGFVIPIAGDTTSKIPGQIKIFGSSFYFCDVDSVWKKVVTNDSLSLIKSSIADNSTNIAVNATSISTLEGSIGSLSSLTTADKTSVVNAIKENTAAISSISTSNFKGSALTTTNPGTPSQNVWYFLNGAGTYTNFKRVKTGTITTSTSTTALTGSSTKFLTELAVGMGVYNGSTLLGTVATITSDVAATLSTNATAAVSGAVHNGPILVSASDGLIASAFDIVTGFWSKNAASIDLTNYTTKTQFDSVKANFKTVITSYNLFSLALHNNPTQWFNTTTNQLATAGGTKSYIIPVTEGQRYTFNGFGTTFLSGAYLFADKSLIVPGSTATRISASATGIINPDGTSNTAARTFVVPTGQSIKYAIVNIPSSGIRDTTFQIETGNIIHPYDTYATALKVDDVYAGVATKLEIADVVHKPDIILTSSFNMIDTTQVLFTKRYSTGSKTIINADVNLIARSGYIAVEEGEYYTVSGSGIYSSYQGGYFAAAGNTSAINNITFIDPVLGSGKTFQVPTGQGIKYVIISLATNSGHTALAGPAQMEKGEMSTDYQPFVLKDYIKPELFSTPAANVGTVFNAEAWYLFTEGESKSDQINKIPVFRNHWFEKDKDLVVVNTGTSLTARSTEHCTTHALSKERPPLMHANNLASILWDKMKWDNQFYRRYDYTSFFTESGTYTNTNAAAEWDDGAYRDGLTRYSASTLASVSFTVPVDAWQFNFIYRSDNVATENATVAIAEGNNKMEVLNEAGTWVEANGFAFSMREATPVTRDVSVPSPTTGSFSIINISTKGNTTYQKRLKMRCKSGIIDSRASTKAVTITATTAGRLNYWGVEWSPREFMITYINAARGSHNTQATSTTGLPRFADNEVWGFKPDFMFFELPIHNDGAGGVTTNGNNGYWGRLTNNFVFDTAYELSMKSRAAYYGLDPEIGIFTSSITWNFEGINDDGTLKMGTNSNGKKITALDKYNEAYSWVIANHPEVIAINAAKRWVDAGFAIFGDLKTATLGSGKNGETMTNEGSHWNNTGSKVMAKPLTGIFDFSY